MSTSVLPRGRQVKTRLAYESAYAANPGANFSELNTYTSLFNRQRPLEDDDVLGAGFANTVDSRPAGPNVEDATGKLAVPLDLAQIGFWLGAALGRVSGTGSAPTTHVFTSGNGALPSLSIEREFVASAQYETLLGGVIKTMKFPIGAGPGYQQVDIDLMAAQITEPASSTGAGTPTVEALANRVPKSVGLIKVGGTQIGSIISGDATLTNEITLDRYIGDSAFPSLAAHEAQSLALNLTARYNTDVLRAYGALGAGTLPPLQAVDIVYSLGASLSLTLHIPYARFEPVDLDVQHGKTLTVALKGRAEVGASNPMLTATLVNAHATY